MRGFCSFPNGGNTSWMFQALAYTEQSALHDQVVAAATPAEAMQAASADRKPNRPSVTIPPRYSQPGQTILAQDVPAGGSVVFELQSQ